MNIDYSLWPIWADYLEEQGFDTELLRYVMTYNSFNNLASFSSFFKHRGNGFDRITDDTTGFCFNFDLRIPSYTRGSSLSEFFQKGELVFLYN